MINNRADIVVTWLLHFNILFYFDGFPFISNPFIITGDLQGHAVEQITAGKDGIWGIGVDRKLWVYRYSSGNNKKFASSLYHDLMPIP